MPTTKHNLPRIKLILAILASTTVQLLFVTGCSVKPPVTLPNAQDSSTLLSSTTEEGVGATPASTTAVVVKASPIEPEAGSETQVTEKVNQPIPTPTVDGAMAFYISPAGDDANNGTTTSDPWKTFNYAFSKLLPGDTLILLDGVYTLQDSGMIDVSCFKDGFPKSGIESAPITIQAQNERKAIIRSDGSVPAVYIESCSNLIITGLSATSADLPTAERNHIFSIRDSTNIILYRLLGSNTNRYFNSHPYAINASSYILILESEAYSYHRHAFDAFQSHHIIFRRCYANSRGYEDLPGGFVSDRPGGDETYVLYHTSDSIIENSIAEYETRGFEVHGGVTFDGQPGGHNNRILGSIHLNGHYAAEIDSRLVDEEIRTAANNLYKDFLVIGSNESSILLNSSVGTRLENVTIFNGGIAGVRVDEKDINNPFCPEIPNGCSFTITNSLIFDNKSYGLRIANSSPFNWLVEYSNITGNGDSNFPGTENINDDQGNVQRSFSVPPFGMSMQGNQTLVYVPEGSNMKRAGKNGSDIGANILYRYENGILTFIPLWDPTTGAFPCGVIVPGINDLPGFSCFDVNQRLNVNANTLPENYGSDNK